MSLQSKSGELGGIQKSGYEGSQLGDLVTGAAVGATGVATGLGIDGAVGREPCRQSHGMIGVLWLQNANLRFLALVSAAIRRSRFASHPLR